MDIANLSYIEALFDTWQNGDTELDSEWKEYFRRVDAGEITLESLLTLVTRSPLPGINGTPASTEASKIDEKQRHVDRLIAAYRELGTFYAKINPLSQYQTPEMRYLRLTTKGITLGLEKEDFQLHDEDLDKKFYPSKYMSKEPCSLASIIEDLKSIYCSNIGYDFLHIKNEVMQRWLFRRVESEAHRQKFSKNQQMRFQKDLIKAVTFESFIQSQFIGQKRFSLEGGETLIAAVHYLIYTASDHGIQEIVLGMAHRGRLNLFTNALRKPAGETFSNFIDKPQDYQFGGSGDVKYHLGHSFTFLDKETNKSVHLSLVANPSHLEAIDPVIQGKARGIQRKRKDFNRKKVVPVLVHGDAAFSGQGVVFETFNLSQLKGYRTGGTIHIVVNNQIGFTTASRNSRSTFFCTDIAKALSVPVFHVNGDAPEDVIRCVETAIAWRQKFGQDVIIDLICYRRRGHNEADEPSYTHPLMYSMIKSHPDTSKIYGAQLSKANIYPEEEQKAFQAQYSSVLKNELQKARKSKKLIHSAIPYRGEWAKYNNPYSFDPVKTGVKKSLLDHIAGKLTEVPDGFAIHPKLRKVVEENAKAYKRGTGINWTFAETMSFGSLLYEQHPVRLSGEDSGRGTFSQRHAQWWDTTAHRPTVHIPLESISDDQAPFSVYDSPLSEFSVLGFDYGYSLAQPNILILWEAQFGDFANGAQVIIDQFIASGEWKWHRSSGIVLLLPHGYEGQGPEHSSAHLERFLQLCAMDNIQVVNLTTPAQYFHALRKQIKQPFRKPLIVMSPKSLLRNPHATSEVKELTGGHFHSVLDDEKALPEAVRTVMFCSGKVFYDLEQHRDSLRHGESAIVRVEQLYPWPKQELARIIARYPRAEKILWVQEEAKNHGAWTFVHERLQSLTNITLRYTGRKATPSPATGSRIEHQKELQDFLKQAFS